MSAFPRLVSVPVPIVTATPVANPNDAVDVESTAYQRMKPKWTMLHDLIGGTETMRAANYRWLPKEPKEEIADYQLRLDRSVLYNATKSTHDRCVVKPFSREVQIKGSLPAPLEAIEDNTDKAGSNLTAFGSEVFRKGIEYGLTHIFVDYPAVPSSATIADEIDQDIRPYFVRIDPPDMLGWRTRRTESGSLQVTQIRFREWRTVSDGMFGDREIECIRVINAPTTIVDDNDTAITTQGTWELWIRDGDEFIKDDEGTHTFPGVPLLTFYVNRTGFMEGAPTYEDLMWLNIRHWQVSSDVSNCLRMVLAAVFYAFGWPEDKFPEMTFGPNVYLKSTDPNCKVGYAEHSGAGISSGNTELEALEERMEILGLQPLIERTANSTATGKKIDDKEHTTDIQAWIRNLEGIFEDAFGFAGKWIGEDELPEDFSIDIFNEFSLGARSSEDIAKLIEMRANGEISHMTFLKEIKRRGTLSDDVVIEDEAEAVAAEIRSLPKSEEPLIEEP